MSNRTRKSITPIISKNKAKLIKHVLTFCEENAIPITRIIDHCFRDVKITDLISSNEASVDQMNKVQHFFDNKVTNDQMILIVPFLKIAKDNSGLMDFLTGMNADLANSLKHLLEQFYNIHEIEEVRSTSSEQVYKQAGGSIVELLKLFICTVVMLILYFSLYYQQRSISAAYTESAIPQSLSAIETLGTCKLGTLTSSQKLFAATLSNMNLVEKQNEGLLHQLLEYSNCLSSPGQISKLSEEVSKRTLEESGYMFSEEEFDPTKERAADRSLIAMPMSKEMVLFGKPVYNEAFNRKMVRIIRDRTDGFNINKVKELDEKQIAILVRDLVKERTKERTKEPVNGKTNSKTNGQAQAQAQAQAQSKINVESGYFGLMLDVISEGLADTENIKDSLTSMITGYSQIDQYAYSLSKGLDTYTAAAQKAQIDSRLFAKNLARDIPYLLSRTTRLIYYAAWLGAVTQAFGYMVISYVYKANATPTMAITEHGEQGQWPTIEMGGKRNKRKSRKQRLKKQ